MANAPHDGNGVPGLLGASNSDGVTPVPILVNPTNHGLIIDDNTTGDDHGVPTAQRDANRVPVLLAVSSADGVTPVEVYADPVTGALLIDSN